MAQVVLSGSTTPQLIYANSKWRDGKTGISTWSGGRLVVTEAPTLPARADMSMVADKQGVLRLTYPGLGSNTGWWYAEWRSGVLTATQVATDDVAIGGGRLILAGEEQPHIAFNIPGKVVYATRMPDGSWSVRTIETNSVWIYPATYIAVNPITYVTVTWPGLAVTPAGTVYVSFYVGNLPDEPRSLRVVSSSDWVSVGVDTWTAHSTARKDWASAIVADPSGIPHVFYTYEEPAPGGLVWRHSVKHAWQTGAVWQTEIVHTWDGAQASMRVAPSTGVDGTLRVVVSWKDLEAWPFTSTSAKGQWVCTKSTTTGGWTCEPVDAPESGVLAMSPAVVDSSGEIHALYVTQKGEIKYASTRALEDATLLPIVAGKTAALVAANNYFSPNAVGANYTRLYYKVATPGRVRVRVYTTDGVLVGTLVDEDKPAAGTFATDWAGKDEAGAVVGTGLYVAELEAPGVREVKKIVVVK